MKRREFITLLGGAAVGWPLTVRAQQSERIRRIGVLMNRPADDVVGATMVSTFKQSLQQLGWHDGHNIRMDVRWGANDPESERRYAVELNALAPDVILASGTMSVAASRNISRTLPIVFVGVADPVGAGFVANLAHPGSNVTGFMEFEYGFSGKWVELLKQIVPSATQAVVLRDAANPAGIAQFGAIRSTASSLGVDVSPIDVRDPEEIERAMAAFARSATGGLIVTPSASEHTRRDLIIALAARYKLPAVYGFRLNAEAGGLISYGPDLIDQFQRAAGYTDRILKGEKPGDLPVQAPTKYELVINLKTAKALGIAVPQSLLASADEVIE
jgi:putative tryptophan/tyrosine transport system substrate-binding protein